ADVVGDTPENAAPELLAPGQAVPTRKAKGPLPPGLSPPSPENASGSRSASRDPSWPAPNSGAAVDFAGGSLGSRLPRGKRASLESSFGLSLKRDSGDPRGYRGSQRASQEGRSSSSRFITAREPSSKRARLP